jgi:argininosuccinate lyase
MSGFALWGTRFKAALAPEADALNRSLPIDARLWREELQVADSWTFALADCGVLTPEEAGEIRAGLRCVQERIAAGEMEGATDEDIHTLIERLLHEEIGELAGKLRTGRSRNDTAATAMRLWSLRAAERLVADVETLQRTLLGQAQATIEVIAPAYTHLQRAQPIRLAHFFLAHFWALERDRARLRAGRVSTATLPLGSGALAGSGFPIDREALCERLGFQTVAPNSLDAVSDRDFVAELAFAGALLGVHLSRLAEDLILFASSEFGFLRFDDAYSTGSSLMPQKRNPDIAELARGQGARLLGDLTAMLTLLKGLPAGYNKDLQEDKAILFRVHDTLHALLPALAGAVGTLRVDAEAVARALDPNLLAVDVADALVRAGLPFGEAHAVVGALVSAAEEAGIAILDLSKERAAKVHVALPAALAEVRAGSPAAAYERSVESHSARGGTSRRSVEEQLEAARALLP